MQNFITIFHSVQEIGAFSFLFRIWSSAKSRLLKNDISQSLGINLVNINVYADVFQNIPLSSRDNAIFTLSEFCARQILNQSQMSFDNLMGNININLYAKLITIFHSFQEIAPLLRFQNLELGKASTNEKCHFAISWARSFKFQCLRNSVSKYFTQFKR